MFPKTIVIIPDDFFRDAPNTSASAVYKSSTFTIQIPYGGSTISPSISNIRTQLPTTPSSSTSKIRTQLPTTTPKQSCQDKISEVQPRRKTRSSTIKFLDQKSQGVAPGSSIRSFFRGSKSRKSLTGGTSKKSQPVSKILPPDSPNGQASALTASQKGKGVDRGQLEILEPDHQSTGKTFP